MIRAIATRPEQQIGGTVEAILLSTSYGCASAELEGRYGGVIVYCGLYGLLSLVGAIVRIRPCTLAKMDLLFMKQRQQVIEIRVCRRAVSKGATRIWMSKVLNMVTRSELFYDVVPRHVSATL